MSTELSNKVSGEKLFDIAPHLTDEQFAKLAKANTFLPRVQLFQSISKLCQLGKFPQGHWGLVRSKDQVEDLGTSFDCVVIQYRSKALDMSSEKPVQCFNEGSEVFQDIVDRSGDFDSGCMWGPEFLLWLPHSKTFATMFFSTPTARNSGDDVKQLHGRACTLGVRFLENKRKQTWNGPTVSICTSPMELPDKEMVIAQNERFIKVQDVETVEDDDSVSETERSR